MKNYLELLKNTLETGTRKKDRTGVGTLSLFGKQLRFDLTVGFPLITTRKLHVWSIIHELIWFLRGDTNIKYLRDNGVTIWDEWADTHGNLGPIYGKQWTNWETKDGQHINQINNAIDLIKKEPNSRRILISAWNVGDLEDMRLLPCHVLFQFYVKEEKILSCQMYQRSADIFLGLPFNIACYALLTHIVAYQTGLSVGELIWVGGDCHLYLNHLNQAKLQLSRIPYPLPQIRINCKRSVLSDYKYEDFEIINYQSHPNIQASVAI